MTKPLIDDTRWAVTAGGVESTLVSVPDGTLKDDGYSDDEIPLAKDWNYWHRKAHKWFQYLDGAVLSGNHSIVGSLTVNGDVTVADQPLTFADFTYTADNTADVILHTAHGLLTGDGPGRTSNSGGGLPGGLAVATDYYFIRVDADTGKLATSRANALANVAINLTTDGTGTQTFLHQAGTTRLSNLTVTGQLLHEQTWQHSIAFALPDASASLSLGVAGTTATRLALLTSTGDNVLPLSIPIGILSKWSVTLNKASAAGTITARIYECNTASGAGVTQIGATQSNSASSPGQITLGQVGLAFGMTVGREYFIVVNGGGTTGDMVTSYYATTSSTLNT